jgi:hypothetical protein
MSTLHRRLDALEEIAAECQRREQRREMRDLVVSLPEAAGLTPDELEAATDEAVRYLEELRCTRA